MGGALYLDIGDETGDVVKITSDGWRINTTSPVFFRRPKGLNALTRPADRGRLDDLRSFFGDDDEVLALVLGFIVASLMPDGPFPILEVRGEQGSGKSTRCAMIRRIVDPNEVVSRGQPRNEQDLAIAAENGWLLVYDNLSGLSQALSDAFCRLSTGGGYATRMLWSGRQEETFFAVRPVIFNGIQKAAIRPDLADRAISVTFPHIGDAERRPESELWEDFDARLPSIMAGVLDALSTALRHLPTVKLDSYPRMADFAKLVVAAEPAFPVPPGTFLESYEQNRNDSADAVLESSIVALRIMRLLEREGAWEGTTAELLGELIEMMPDQGEPQQNLPRNVQGFVAEFTRVMPVLRRFGIERESRPRASRGQVFRLTKSQDRN